MVFWLTGSLEKPSEQIATGNRVEERRDFPCAICSGRQFLSTTSCFDVLDTYFSACKNSSPFIRNIFKGQYVSGNIDIRTIAGWIRNVIREEKIR